MWWKNYLKVTSVDWGKEAIHWILSLGSLHLKSSIKIIKVICMLFYFLFILLFYYFIFKTFFIVVQLQLSAFSPHPSIPTQPIPPPSPVSTLPLEFVHVSFIVSSSCKPLSPLSPPHSPLAIVRLFLTSMSLAIFCLFFSFVDYVPVS